LNTAGTGFTLEGVGVEIVEGSDKAKAHPAAFWRRRIHIIEMLEVRLVLHIIEECERMAELAVLRMGNLDADDLCCGCKACELEQGTAIHRHGGNLQTSNGRNSKRAYAKENTGKWFAGVKFP
jgi:hypothetical protein